MAKVKLVRPFTICVADLSHDDGTWSQLHPEKKIVAMQDCEFGFAEEIIGLVEYEDGTFEVGIGESMRPYRFLYGGKDAEKASAAFITAIIRLASEEEEE